jgi:hypothetical protein
MHLFIWLNKIEASKFIIIMQESKCIILLQYSFISLSNHVWFVEFIIHISSINNSHHPQVEKNKKENCKSNFKYNILIFSNKLQHFATVRVLRTNAL